MRTETRSACARLQSGTTTPGRHEEDRQSSCHRLPHSDAVRPWYDEEGLGARAICRRLNEQQKPAKRGGKWHPTTVAWIIDPAARETNRVRSAFDRAQKKEETRRTRASKILGSSVR
ncbi:recombinase family protein [Streptomyces sp. NPDC056943]|uniref:recombinase family protein n=1 Tax=Streptomyces sp. NPDC056943 TaxID=3345971 RepID=UPI00362F938A